MKKNDRINPGVIMGIPLLITVVFILINVFSSVYWGFLWIFSPLWIPAVLITIFLILTKKPKDYYGEENID